ncbi:aromatic ring-hydroxylating oxygenase subunit alpha [Elongatibacter sediminis]|uniref:Aromatic ring-hydroxylating dioxygenase subunit alpha n=1 Tax=Elongatibacter sediminis TaxID=3119006 RepID=A0AAW9RG06_9GAMM
MWKNPVESWRIDPDANAGHPEAKQPWVDNGLDIHDPSRYYDPAFMEHEWKHLWTRCWLIAGVETDIPEPGDYSVFRLRRESIVIVRQDDGSVRAFYNVCAHRGNQLVLNDRGSVARFTCAFHSWQYGLDGVCTHITDEETFNPALLKNRPRMGEIRCETHAGLVFINLDDEAPPLEERLGLPDGYLEAYELDKMYCVRHVVSEWAANWKTGVDAFYETYHLHAVHPETQDVMDDLGVQVDLYPHGGSRMIVPIGVKTQRQPDPQAMNASLEYMMAEASMDPSEYPDDAREVRRAIQQAKRRRSDTYDLGYERFTDNQLTDSWATGIFPNVQIGLHAEGAFLMRFMPHPTDPERFFYDTMTLIRPVDDPDYRTPGWMGLPEDTDTSGEIRPDTEYVPLGEPPHLGLVLDQDSELLPVVQRGVRSRGFNGAIWGEQEQRLRHFHRELQRYLDGEK